MSAAAELTPADYSPRQNAVLECALRLLVEGGEKALTTARVAREANCSKESLTSGSATATVSWPP